MKNALILASSILFTLSTLNAEQVITEKPYSALGLGTCFKRIYSKEHMQAHPTQKLSEIYVSFKEITITYTEAGESDTYVHIAGKVTGVKTGTTTKYTNTAASYKGMDDYGTRFGVDDDGGAYKIKKTSNGKDMMLSVDDSYYFPLYRVKDRSDDAVSLDFDTFEDRNWKLKVADPAECTAVEYELIEEDY